MKSATSIGMLAAVAFAVGMTGINLSDGTFELYSNTPTPTSFSGGAGITGHIEVIHTDSEGNILSYQQTDNAIVNDGRNCTAMLLFGVNSGCTAATPGDLGTYTWIGLGNGTADLPEDTTRTTLVNEISAAGDGIERAQGSVPVTAGPTGFTNATADGASATQRITNQFTYTGSEGGNVIREAGLFNGTLGEVGVFALKNFPSQVSLNNGDQLTVNWDITISGTDPMGP